MSVVIQKNFPGKKASKLIDGRFQIMEAWLRDGQHYVFDHDKSDQIRDKKGEISYFDSHAEALNFISGMKGGKRKK